MGGCCCCAAKATELNNAPLYYHYPSASIEHVPLSSHHGTVCTLSNGLLVDTNLNTSVPETYRAPPAPVPYETYVGRPQTPSANRESYGNKSVVAQARDKPLEGTNSGTTQDTAVKDVKSDENAQNNTEANLVKEVVDGLEKSGELKKPTESIVTFLQEEEDVCPTCLEEYDAENPKIITKCEHHFHLACILEWMQRSDTCPVCNQEMIFNTANES